MKENNCKELAYCADNKIVNMGGKDGKSFARKLKDNNALRGLHSLWREYFGLPRRKFGYVGEKVVMIPPLNIDNLGNVYLYGLNKIEHCTISASLAKFVMKYGSAAAEGLTVHTGNHMRVSGKYYRTVTNQDKLDSGKKLDLDVVVEEDVWIGCNVTLSGWCDSRKRFYHSSRCCCHKEPSSVLHLWRCACKSHQILLER